MIQAISFAMHALVYGPEGGDFISEVLRAEGIAVEPVEVSEAMTRLPEDLAEFRSTIATEEQEEDYRRAMLGPLLANLGIPFPTDALLMRLVETLYDYPAYYSLFPETLPVLQELRSRGFKLAVVSNWEPSLRRCVRELELDHLFDAVLSSMEIGAAKPDPFIFGRALSGLGVPADWTLHVGPGLAEDVAGALRAGIRPVWLNRTGIATGHEVLTITDLRGLLMLAQKAGE